MTNASPSPRRTPPTSRGRAPAAAHPWTSRRRARTSTAQSCPPVAPVAPIRSAKGRARASRSPSPQEWQQCGLLTTGEPNVVAAAHARGETVQAMFRRLLQATARRPTPWDAQAMGPGIVDARALLEASFDLGLGRGAANLQTKARASAASSVASLVAEAVGADAVPDDALDWHQFGPELATALLGRQLPGPPGRSAAAGQVSEPLARNISNPRLRDWLGLGGLGRLGTTRGPLLPARPLDEHRDHEKDRQTRENQGVEHQILRMRREVPILRHAGPPNTSPGADDRTGRRLTVVPCVSQRAFGVGTGQTRRGASTIEARVWPRTTGGAMIRRMGLHRWGHSYHRSLSELL